MKPDELINQIEQTVAPFTSYFERLHDEGEFSAQFNDTWTMCDILAHVLWYEEEMLQLLATKSMHGTSSIWRDDIDERNKLIYDQMTGIDNEELLSRHRSVVKQLCASVADLTEEHLTNAKFFKDMPEDWQPWKIIAGSKFYHYTDHLRRLQEFRE